jgi:hypothetical protein
LPQARIAASNSRNAVSFSLACTFLRGPLRDQTHRERMNRPLQFQKRGQHFIGANDETPSIVAVRVHNPDCSAFNING